MFHCTPIMQIIYETLDQTISYFFSYECTNISNFKLQYLCQDTCMISHMHLISYFKFLYLHDNLSYEVATNLQILHVLRINCHLEDSFSFTIKCFAKNFIRLLISYLHKKVKLSQNSYSYIKEREKNRKSISYKNNK